MLGRSYAVLWRFKEAAAVVDRATTLLGPSADLLADHADGLATA